MLASSIKSYVDVLAKAGTILRDALYCANGVISCKNLIKIIILVINLNKAYRPNAHLLDIHYKGNII